MKYFIALSLLILFGTSIEYAHAIKELKQNTPETFPYCTNIEVKIYNATIQVRYVPQIEENGLAFRRPYSIHIKNPRIETLAHEATHIADFIYEDKGLQGYEARAYLVGYITGELYRCFHSN